MDEITVRKSNEQERSDRGAHSAPDVVVKFAHSIAGI